MANPGDSDDLEALFDQISSETLAKLDSSPAQAGKSAAAPAPEDVEGSPEFYQRVGALTRQLHDALRELGYQQKVEEAVSAMPDTRQRLAYIAQLTGQAAERAIANVEKGQEIMGRVERDGGKLNAQWQQLFACQLGVDDFKKVAGDTNAFLARTQEDARATSSLLTDIMMAQDFHDLTGQVIQKVVKLAQDIEGSMVKLLLESTPPEKLSATQNEWLNGPVIDAVGRDDVVTSQGQVDDLLASLGF